jgi:hypothetical protein
MHEVPHAFVVSQTYGPQDAIGATHVTPEQVPCVVSVVVPGGQDGAEHKVAAA